jgi:hypothetical protein
MRRFYLVVVLAILIQACAELSLEGLGQQPTLAPVSNATATVSLTPLDTLTPSSTPTITPSPTIIRIPTQDPNQPTVTFAPIPILIGNDTATPYFFTLPTPPGPGLGFLSVEVTDKKIYWGSCKPHKTRIITKVENPDDVFSVIIFVQVKHAFKEDYTPWSTGNAMQPHGGGKFTYVLDANTTRGHNHYKNSWIRFQLVATDDSGEAIGRTMIYTNEIALSPCLGIIPQ